MRSTQGCAHRRCRSSVANGMTAYSPVAHSRPSCAWISRFAENGSPLPATHESETCMYLSMGHRDRRACVRPTLSGGIHKEWGLSRDTLSPIPSSPTTCRLAPPPEHMRKRRGEVRPGTRLVIGVARRPKGCGSSAGNKRGTALGGQRLATRPDVHGARGRAAPATQCNAHRISTGQGN